MILRPYYVLTVVSLSVHYLISETDDACQSSHHDENIVKQLIRNSPTNDLTGKQSLLWSQEIKAGKNFENQYWHTFHNKVKDSSHCKNAWASQDLVSSLKQCGWRHAVVIHSERSDTVGGDFDQLTKPDELKGFISDTTQSFFKKPASNDQKLQNYSSKTSLIVQSLLDAFHESTIPVQHFQQRYVYQKDLKRRLTEVLWISYNSMRNTNFVYVSERPWDILQAAQTLFRRHHRGRGALMPHRTRFLLVGQERSFMLQKTSSSLKHSSSSLPLCCPKCHKYRPKSLKDTETQLGSSDFDNVLLTLYSHKHKRSPEHSDSFFNLLQTLMWREKRKREFQPVSHALKEQRSCELFPNIQNRMNGRSLVFLAKEWGELLKAENDNGSLRYTGLIYEIAQVLSVSMNFTYSFFPSILASRNVSWNELREMLISGGTGDLILSLYYISSSLTYNYSQPYPIFNTNMTGVHASRPDTQVLLFVQRINPMVYILIAVSFLFILFYLTFLFTLSPSWTPDEFTTQSYSNKRFYKHPCKRYFFVCWKIFFALLGSWLSQSNAPQSRFFSSRIIIFSWCICILILTATFRGDLTSSLVKTDPSPPFKTFNELLLRNDYRWGHHHNSTFLDLMKTTEDPTLSKLYTGIVRFAAKDPYVLTFLYDSLLIKVINDDKFVAIIDSFSLKISMSSLGLKSVKVMPDSLGINGLAPALPLDSELTGLMSENIIALSETGIFELLVDNMNRELMAAATKSFVQSKLNDTTRSKDFEGAEQQDAKKIDVMVGLFVGSLLIILATVILWIELLYHLYTKKNSP